MHSPSPHALPAVGVPGVTDEVAAILSSLIAGALYLAMQMLASGLVLQGGSALDTLQRIAAMLLGPDEAPPPSDLNGVDVGIAVLVHLLLSLGFGCAIAAVIERLKAFRPAVVGAALGLGLYLLNYLLIGSQAFPWLLQSHGVLTAANHVLFGIVVSQAYVRLRQPGRSRAIDG